MKYFPQSLLAASLEYSGPIILTNPLVTPELLQEIQRILTTQRLEYHQLPQTNLRAAVNYLNMPLLLLLEEPLLPLFQTLYPDFDLLDTEMWIYSQEILEFAVDNNACLMLEVSLQLIPQDTEKEFDGLLLVASQNNYPQCVRLLLKRVDPSKIETYTEGNSPEEITHNGALYMAIKHQRPENVRVLLDDPRTTFQFQEALPIENFPRLINKQPMQILNIIPGYRYDIFAMIISDPRLTQEEIILFMSQHLVLPLIRLCFTRPDLNLNDSGLYNRLRSRLFGEAMRPLDFFRIFLTDPRFDPNLFLNMTFEEPTLISSSALFQLLLDPCVKVNDLPEGLYISLLYLNSPEVLQAFLERPDISRQTRLKLYQYATIPLSPYAKARNATMAVDLIRPRLNEAELASNALIQANEQTIDILMSELEGLR
jgi:hypothetical protein